MTKESALCLMRLTIKDIIDWIECNIATPLPLKVLAQKSGYSARHFQRGFKKITRYDSRRIYTLSKNGYCPRFTPRYPSLNHRYCHASGLPTAINILSRVSRTLSSHARAVSSLGEGKALQRKSGKPCDDHEPLISLLDSIYSTVLKTSHKSELVQ